jgi:pimeloyl-ACP methyl ester carboxylesterase
VRSRTVFFLSGFDPKGAAHYHALYRDEAARQASAGGLSIQTGPRRRLDNGDACWSLSAGTPSGPVTTRYHFMRWDDIVRKHWPRGSAELWFEVVRTNLFNLRHGALWRMLQSAWPPLLAVVLGLPLVWAVAFWFLTIQGWGALWSALAGLIPAAGLLWVAHKLEGRLSMSWLMRSYAFNRRQALGQTPELEQRLDQHAATLILHLRQAQDDEVLLVGHSSGAIMAASVLARALKLDPALGSLGPRVALLTLGHWIPLLGCLPQAGAFRSELHALGCARDIDWIDFTAPPDGCCFALVDPLAACGVEREGSATDRPKLLSPRFMNMFEPERYRQLRRDKFRVHFQYLMASEKPAGYDYFAITAGDQQLAARFAAQPSVTDFTGLRLFRRGRLARNRNG